MPCEPCWARMGDRGEKPGLNTALLRIRRRAVSSCRGEQVRNRRMKKYKCAQTIVLIGFEDKTMYYVGEKFSNLTNLVLTNVCTWAIMASLTGKKTQRMHLLMQTFAQPLPTVS